jgi:DNA mismatch endonuclease, patch repair protein
MRGNRSRDTKPELALRRALHREGLRFHVHRRIEPTRTYADIVFPRRRIAVFVDGCFWHGCPRHYRPSTKNAAYWSAKIIRNVTRDRANDVLLKERGWTVVRVWEHEPIDEAVERIAALVRSAALA